MSKKTTKRALAMSFVSVFLCVCMLVGTTFAWFTDSVTSSNNIIASGTLKVAMSYADGKEAVPADGSTAWKDASNVAIFNNKLWEPGYVDVKHIQIKNTGTLALKYKLDIFANGTVSDLANVIDVYYSDPATQVADRAALADAEPEGTLAEMLTSMSTTASGELPAGESHTVTIALKMRESATNEYQNKSIGSDFAVQLVAAQLTAEDDSFNNQYDATATWDGTIPTAMPDTLVVDHDAKTITVNDAAAFAYLHSLDDVWVEKYAAPGTDGSLASHYWTVNGGQGENYYYNWQFEVLLNCDIDLFNLEWTPLNLEFFGNFNGQGHIIKNVKVTSTADYAGLFSVSQRNISNLIVDSVNVTGKNDVGALVGCARGGVINNVTVKNAIVTGTKYVGGITGYTYASITNSSVSDSKITVPATGNKEAGGLAGYLCTSGGNPSSVMGNTVENTTISAPTVASALVSQTQANSGAITVSDNTVKNVTVTTADTSANAFVSYNVGGTTTVENNTETNCTLNKG